MKNTYFISDIHLGSLDREQEIRKEKMLAGFLDSIRGQTKSLFIVGDLFDFWFEYKHAIPKGHYKILNMLSDLKTNGAELFFILGNHDFWVADFFETEVGMKLYPDPHTFEIEGKNFYLNHGDGVARADRGYRILKKILRNSFLIKAYRYLPPDWGIPLAKKISATSRDYTKERDWGNADYLEIAHREFAGGADFVLFGHRHIPERLEFDGKVYMNIGDWIVNFTYGKFDGKQLTLERWKG